MSRAAVPASDRGVVLLGATGFVGSAVVRQLATQVSCGRRFGDVRLLVHRRRLPLLPDGASVHAGSVAALPDGLLPAFPHVVIHCASKQIDHDGSGFGVNVTGVEHLARAVNRETRAILFVSSHSVYGEGPQRGVREDAPLQPASPLALSRAQCETALAALAARGACAVSVFRTRFVLGPGDRHVLPGLARLLAAGLSVGNGDQRYSVIDVDDFARILLAFAERHLNGTAPRARFEAYNVGYERPISLGEIRALLDERQPLPPPRWRLPVYEPLLRLIGRLPAARLRQMVQRLRLVGHDHYGDVAKLRAALGNDWLQTDPREAVRRALQGLHVEGRARA
ncbi:NAD-dependent epimerase/dehydratase family protein [Caldimonas brevitalea]|uniref:NAD-dependent epimerase/dehydratase family protein n=1 Tax=Caldimonas brevitalea TaxID=413882 RepID=UPI0014702BF0|nr:NAD(P)-dependent oxidoreductase [Caldimonas brevitalea]